jgi:hypothetical protein
MTGLTVPPCPQCGGRRVDEYTHYGCPDGSSDHAHRHWVCVTCEFEFVTPSDAQESVLLPTTHGGESVTGSDASTDS